MSDAPRLRILVVGASGVLGRAVVAELGARHEIVAAGSKSGDVRLDIADPDSIVAGLKAAGPLDAVVCAAGVVNFAPLDAIAPAPIAAVGLWARSRQQADGPSEPHPGGARGLTRRRLDHA